VFASVLGELAASSVRVPADFVKQRLQAGIANSFWDGVRGLARARSSVLLASWRATAMRDISHSSLQFPLYEGIKLAVARQTGKGTVDCLPAWQAACCGSVAGAASAFLTAPLDLLRTRVNLCSALAKPAQDVGTDRRTLASKEIHAIYRQRGISGFFVGAGYRAACMGLGGFVFLGAFEAAKTLLSGDSSRQSASAMLAPALHAAI
jgi:solute carrier family 25 S-adenosylmethionine transporter 26